MLDGRKALCLGLSLFLCSGAFATSAFYEATTEHADRERDVFNLLNHLDWEAHERAQPTDEELDAAGVTRDEINTMRPYIPGQRIKQLYPIMEDLKRKHQERTP